MTFRRDYFKRLRMMRGFTVYTLAKKIGVVFQTVSAWENGRQCPTANHLPKISKALKIKPEDLYVFDKGEKI